MKKQIKTVLIIFSVLIMLSFTACTTKTDDSDGKSVDSSSEQNNVDEQDDINEQGDINGQVDSACEHVISHRGASGEETEHTAAAYDLAILYGSKYIEQDVVTSKDGTLYVSHDSSAQKITGVDKLYSEMTDEEIDELRTVDGQKILKLSEVFDKYGDSVTYVIELKDKESQVDIFAALVKEYGNEDSIIVQCFDIAALEALEPIFPDMKKMYLIDKKEDFEAGLNLDFVDILAVCAWKDGLMSEENCKKAHDAGKEFNVWTINLTQEIIRAIEMDVDSYFTNYTAKALALEKIYRK